MSEQQHSGGEEQVEQQQQQQQQEEAQEQQEVRGQEKDYSSSDDDEWTRPSADAIKKAEEANANAEADANKTKTMENFAYDEDESNLAGGDVIVHFVIRSASGGAPLALAPQRFVMGVTVAHLKTHLEDAHKLPYAAQQMFLGEQLLIDPLSLNDVGFKSGEAGNTVYVDVNEEQQ